jgi:hypothetical protein
MCICVNCHYVDRCLTYHMVETQHEQPHLTETPDFEPVEPSINVNHYFPKVVVTDDGRIVQEGDFGKEWDVVGCKSFKLEAGKWAKLRPGELIPT